MRRFLSLILTAALIFSLAACSDRGANKSISYALDSSPSTLDPQYADEAEAQIVISNTFEGLVRISAEGQIIPGIAQGWSISEDGLTYTFNLKPATEWYCPISLKSEFGNEFYEKYTSEIVTANDFVFAMRRAINPATGSAFAHRLFVIRNATDIYSGALPVEQLGVTAVDDNTLIIELAEPCADFLERLTEGVFMPCNEEFFNSMNGRYGLTQRHILCNGPFYVSSWDSESALTIRRNNYYAGKQQVIPSLVNFTFDPDENSVAKKISNGTVSAALLPPDCPAPENSVTVKETANSVFGFVFNCADSSLSNTNLRLALCSSIDRTLFTENDNAVPQNGFVPPSCVTGSLYYRNAVGEQTPFVPFDTAKAADHWKKALSELGVQKIGLTVLCPEWLDNSVRRQLQIWQKTLGIGLGITIENKTSEEIEKAVSSGNYQIALTGITTPYESASDFLASLKDGNPFRHKSEEYNAIVARILEIDGEQELLGGCFTAENYILQQGLCYPLYSRSSRFVCAEDVDGIAIFHSENNVSFIGARRYD